MTATTVANFRVYELPWTPSESEERRFRRVLGAALGIFIGLGIVIPLLPERPRTEALAPAVPERIVEFLLEQPKPKPAAEGRGAAAEARGAAPGGEARARPGAGGRFGAGTRPAQEGGRNRVACACRPARGAA